MDGRRSLHVGIIMDGNSRWAERRDLRRESGHKAGYRNVLAQIDAALDLSLSHLTLYAFSTENWGRDSDEVASLMRVFATFFDRDAPVLAALGVRTRTIGRLDGLPAQLVDAITRAEEAMPASPRLDVLLALGYGGRMEIADAVRRAYRAGDAAALDGDEQALARYLYAPDVPPPDLIIRTGGRHRLSNFLLWQAAYSELWFTDTLWPDFDRSELEGALADLMLRTRTFGGRSALQPAAHGAFDR